MGHCGPMTQVQLELNVETRFETATLLPTHLEIGKAHLVERRSRALWALELLLSEDVLWAMQEGYQLGYHSYLHCACLYQA